MRLYHFMKEKYALIALQNRKLKIAEIDKLNDPFEFLCVKFPDDKHWKAFEKYKKENFGKKRGLICFSAAYYDPVQWAHYSDNHQGICLGFDVNDDYFHERKLLKVNYEPEKLKIPDNFTDANHKDSSALFMIETFRTKYKNWAYEEEYRLFPNLPEPIDELYFYDFDEGMQLKEVILGCRSKLEEDELYRYMGNLKNTVDVFKTKTSSNEFKIKKYPLK